jgi:hypothetical protein
MRVDKVLEVDLSRSPPLVACEGVAVAGVTRAAVVLTPDGTPVLELRLMVFDVTGGKLPHGLRRISLHDQD